MILFFFTPVFSQGVLELKDGWEYNWDFSPTDKKATEPILQRPGSENWKPYKLQKPIPDRNGRNILWIRNRIPSLIWKRPAIYFPFIEFTYEAYAENKLLSRFGNMNDNGSCYTDTWIQHQIIPLPEFKVDYIYMKICSPYPSIGISGIPKIGNAEYLYREHILSEIPLLAFGIFFLVCSIFSFYFFTKRTSEKILLHFSLITLTLFVICVYHTSFRLEIWNDRKTWTDIILVSANLISIFMIKYIECLTGSGWKYSIAMVRNGIYIFAIISGIFIFFDRDLKYHTLFAVSFFLLQIINILIVFFNFILRMKTKKNEIYIFVGSFAVMLVSIIFHFLYEVGRISYWFFYFPAGFVVFVIGLGWIAGERYSKVYDSLQDHTENLERKIAERSLEIEDAHKIALANEIKIAGLEKENALIQERERIFTDMHDHMGYHLSDMRFQIRNLKTSNKQEEECKKNLSASLEKVIQGFRSRLNTIEDLKILKSDFMNGLRLMIFRRYENAGRKIKFTAGTDVVDYFLKSENENQKEILFAIIQEICTNDLKYGLGASELRFILNDKLLKINFSAGSKYRKDSRLLEGKENSAHRIHDPVGSGMGTKNLISRVAELNGSLLTNIQDNIFSLEIQLPMAVE